ncbi:DUF1287 domain-containing protein [Flavobacterium gelidilacus]|uniref:DUF1287 domain-containing protein n=1 Tax=Flavobacterium gelidilacus TaxID=206041 RepID=UPI00041AAF7F|nr:DUF1287 domain-containing protein [Flavobacterium gelidilacus]
MKQFLYIFTLLFTLLSCKKVVKSNEIVFSNPTEIIQDSIIKKPNSFAEKLSNAVISIIDDKIVYTPSYVAIKYPNGDVPSKTGVCTDVIIRAYRKLGIDLQKEVHEDMKANFFKYRKTWGLTKTDTNIDHRRVPNLEVFFERKGEKLIASQNASDYKTGDLITWMINGKLPHIGIVTHLKSDDGKRNLIVHNVGGGQILQDCLFSYEIVGHYRYEK